MKKTKLLAVSGICSAFALLCLLVASYLRWFAVMAAATASIAVCIPLLIDTDNGIFSLLAYLSSSILGAFLGVANIGYVAIIAAFAMPFSMWKCFVEGKLAGKTLFNNATPYNTNSHQPTTDHLAEQSENFTDDPFFQTNQTTQSQQSTFKNSPQSPFFNNNQPTTDHLAEQSENFTDDPFFQTNQTTQSQQSTFKNSPDDQQFQNNQTPSFAENFEQGKKSSAGKLSRAILTVVKWIGYFVISEVGLFLTALCMWVFTPSVFEELVQSGYIYIGIAVVNLAVFPLNFLLNPAFAFTRNVLKKAGLH